jgi:phosphatidylglycerol:prolipoprotein diacylglycerol transferase
LFFWLIIALVVGARLFEVIIWNPSYYLSNPLQIFAVWKGGMAFHGGLIGVVIAALLFCKKRKLSFYKVADVLVLPASLAMALVRVGNFINGELYGIVTTVPWCFKFPSAEGCRHPSQLYESLYNIVNFFILFGITKLKNKSKKYKDGFVFWSFIFFYGILRFVTEFWRYSDVRYLGLNLGQILSLIMIPVGLVMMIRLRKK